MKKKYVFFAGFMSMFLTSQAWEGLGTQEQPYLLSTAQDIIDLASYYGPESKEPVWFLLTQDIDMKHQPISPVEGTFNGYLDGQHYKIENLLIDQENGDAALFLRVDHAEIRDLTIASGYIRGSKSAAALVLNADYSKIINCRNLATIIAEGTYAGPVGGLIASSVYSEIRNCVNQGNVLTSESSSSNIGGIVGSTNGFATLDSCANYGFVKGGTAVGGIAGSLGNNDEAYHSYNLGVVNGVSKVGGIIGTQPIPLIAENDSSYVYMSWNGGPISGEELIGGIGGDVKTIRYAANVGLVSGENANKVGGICGSGDVIYAYNLGDVSGNQGVGGIAGTVGSINTCFNRGVISGTDRVGGIGGQMSGTSSEISFSYNSSKVHSEGSEDHTCGAVVGYINYGGFINSNKITDTYWNKDLEEIGYSGEIGSKIKITGLSGDELKENDLKGFVSDDAGVNEGYPVIDGFDFSDSPKAAEVSTIEIAEPENGRIFPAVTEWTSSVGSSLSFKVQPDAGYQLSDVMVDGQSIKDESKLLPLIGEAMIYTFEPTQAKHSLSFVFTQPTNIESVQGEVPSVWMEHGAVCIQAKPDLSYVIYTVDGEVVCQGKTTAGIQKITWSDVKKVCLVKVGDYVCKIMK